MSSNYNEAPDGGFTLNLDEERLRRKQGIQGPDPYAPRQEFYTQPEHEAVNQPEALQQSVEQPPAYQAPQREDPLARQRPMAQARQAPPQPVDEDGIQPPTPPNFDEDGPMPDKEFRWPGADSDVAQRNWLAKHQARQQTFENQMALYREQHMKPRAQAIPRNFAGTPQLRKEADGSYTAVYLDQTGSGETREVKNVDPGAGKNPPAEHNVNADQLWLDGFVQQYKRKPTAAEVDRHIAAGRAPQQASVSNEPETMEQDGRTFIKTRTGWKELSRPKEPTAAQSEGMVQLQTALNNTDDALQAINEVDGGNPPEGAIGQLQDSVKQRGAQIAYGKLGITSARSKMIQKVALLKAMRTGGLLKGVRNQKYIDQIWSHMPDENKDSTTLMREKLSYIQDQLGKTIEMEKAVIPGQKADTGGVSVRMAPGDKKPLSSYWKQ